MKNYKIAILNHEDKSISLEDFNKAGEVQMQEVEDFLTSKGYKISNINYMFSENIKVNIKGIITSAAAIATERIESEWDTLSCAHEIVRDEDGELMFTGEALNLFNQFYEQYFKLLTNNLM